MCRAFRLPVAAISVSAKPFQAICIDKQYELRYQTPRAHDASQINKTQLSIILWQLLTYVLRLHIVIRRVIYSYGSAYVVR